MTRPPFRLACAAALYLAGAAIPVACAQSVVNPGGFAPGRILVEPVAGLPAQALNKILNAVGGNATRIGRGAIRVVDLQTVGNEKAIVARLAHNPFLRFAELDRRVASSFIPNDPYYGSQWHLAQIGAPTAWDSTQGAGVTIGICDSGVMPNHPDLQANLVPGWNFVANSNSTADVYGHGTAVAGTAAAIVNNGVGVAGVAGAAQIMPLVVTDSTGYAYYSTIASCVTYLADHGVRIANASFETAFTSAAVQSAGSYLKSKNGLLITSAGNYGTLNSTPALTSMIPVSATDSTDTITSWSSYGPYVALSAPGQNIYTTTWNGGYGSWWGTSFSSPIVAGVAAMMMSINPALSNAQVESLLYATAVDLGAPGRDIYYGYGRVNAAAAVAAARSAVATDTIPPTASISAPLAGSTVSALVTVGVNATDNVGVTKVVLLANGKAVATDTASPWQFSWDSTSVANGTATLSAQAYDAAGNVGTSAPVSVTVNNASVPSTTPPTIRVTNPGNGSKVSGMTAVATSATDVLGAAAISQWLYIDTRLVATGSGSSISYNWNTKKVSAGSHTIMAVAQDTAGNKASSTIQVTK
ncbi:MAG: S8 family serine peptidase [Burkholderiales bacterium]|nr:S8 family serine peptidase [Burkholderiales bacterium]MDE1927737.1 S8 family serine peptidase [Burkholderiales bacterium]MDE2158190.1 S8 family serine peptidase [Burkholderiales bacterium]